MFKQWRDIDDKQMNKQVDVRDLSTNVFSNNICMRSWSIKGAFSCFFNHFVYMHKMAYIQMEEFCAQISMPFCAYSFVYMHKMAF